MALYSNLESFHGLPAQDFKIIGDIADLPAVASCLRCEYDDDGTLSDYLTEPLAEPDAGKIQRGARLLAISSEIALAFDKTA
jgi:hypothetical protein